MAHRPQSPLATRSIGSEIETKMAKEADADTPDSRRTTTATSTKPRLTREDWQAERQARRERQREQNIIRATQMHSARLAFEASNRPEPQATLSQRYVGCSGWFYWHWRGRFYPPDSKTSDWFSHYGTQFNTVELNAPFYAWPTVGTVKGWSKQSPMRSWKLPDPCPIPAQPASWQPARPSPPRNEWNAPGSRSRRVAASVSAAASTTSQHLWY